jgi:hypothetical protein
MVCSLFNEIALGNVSRAQEIISNASSTQQSTAEALEKSVMVDTGADEVYKIQASSRKHGISVDVAHARDSIVVRAPGLLNQTDLDKIEKLRKKIAALESPTANNPQNANHRFKVCTFLNKPPARLAETDLGDVLDKLRGFATRAWAEGKWSGDSETPGPIHSCDVDVASLSTRVVEHWHYEVGGGLEDPFHYDIDSVLTLVACLSDEKQLEGGVFRTNEAGGSQLEHPLAQGDTVCFISHKYHNVTPVTKGIRKSLVVELWQGGKKRSRAANPKPKAGEDPQQQPPSKKQNSENIQTSSVHEGCGKASGGSE